ncbi:hypothetical protein CAC42_2805 [Sphaceloma murrayae]|uniref:COMPASS component SDC1 n=1 Tax=Sphaceloma murrayae TaxID=2082308 RepID=A0A2K1R0Q3_9PEZI|nr:hypothetical protein CAC42_2805 [Sphaceloma murrayae]
MAENVLNGIASAAEDTVMQDIPSQAQQPTNGTPQPANGTPQPSEIPQAQVFAGETLAAAPTPAPPAGSTTPARPASQPPTTLNLPDKPVPHGSPTRVYLNQNLTPHLLEGMKYLAAYEPEKPLKWLSEFLAKKSAELEGP